MKNLRSIFRKALPNALLFSLTCVLVYIVSQQVYRLSANDPQYSMAEDLKMALDQGTSPGVLVNPAYTLEISKSLSPFIIIADTNGKLLNTNATLNNMPPNLPKGLLHNVVNTKIQATTWQPQRGVRIASVLILAGPNKDKVVLTGRSLKRIEERIEVLGQLVLLAWLLSLVVYGLVLWFLEPKEA